MTNGGELRFYEINPVIVADDPEVLKEPLFAGAGLMMATDLIMCRHLDEGRVQRVMPGWLGRCPGTARSVSAWPYPAAQAARFRRFLGRETGSRRRAAAFANAAGGAMTLGAGGALIVGVNFEAVKTRLAKTR
jgi:hypothetical protein